MALLLIFMVLTVWVCLVGLNKNTAPALEAGKEVAMQIAAMNPVAVDQDSVSTGND